MKSLLFFNIHVLNYYFAKNVCRLQHFRELPSEIL